jgi:hypothetical protein
MKRIAIALLLAFALEHAPFRLAALVTETLVMKPGPVRVVHPNDRFWDAIDLETRLLSMGWQVMYRPILGAGLFGVTDSRQHTITVDSSLKWNARYAVLAHEAAHTLQPFWLSTEQGEAFAEIVSMLLCHDGLREHARYLADKKVDVVLVALVEGAAAYHAVAVLTDK